MLPRVNSIASAVLAVLLCVSSAQAGNVIDLTPDNFDKVVDGSKNVLVEFYAPWCGHCKRLEPEYEVSSTEFNTPTSDTVLARVDADEHRDLGFRFSIRGYPTLKWFPKGAHTAPTDYDGGRTAEAVTQWVKNKVASTTHAQGTDGGAATGAAAAPAGNTEPVTELTTSNFDQIVKFSNKWALVEFYAPWCGHCKHLVPEYEKLGKSYLGSDKMVITKINADEHRDVGSRYGIRGFPTIKLFAPGGVNPIEYEGARTADAMGAWVAEKSGVAAGASTSTGDDPLIKLNPDNWDQHMDGSKHALIEFYAPWCGHCQRIAPEYTKLSEMYRNNGDVLIGTIDCDAHKGTPPCRDISTYPTIKYFPNRRGSPPELYQGERNAQAFKNYIDARVSGAEAKWAGIGILELSSAPEGNHLAEFVARFSKGADVALVHYYNPSNQVSVDFRKTYEEAFWRLAGQKVRFGEVDVSKETEWANEFSVQETPYVQLWYKAEPIRMLRAPSLADLMSFTLSYASGKEVHYLDTITDTSNLIHAEPLAALGFFKDEKDPAARAFAAAGQQFQFELDVGLVSNPDLAVAFGVNRFPAILLFVRDDIYVYNGRQDDAQGIARWMGSQVWSPVNELSKNAYARQQAFGNVPVLAFLDMEDKEGNSALIDTLTTLSKEYENTFGFLYGNATKWRGFYKHLGVTGEHFPALVISNLVKGAIYPYRVQDVSHDALKGWLQDYIDGKLPKWIKSEPTPENNTGPLTIVTADTFDAIVLEQDDKDVLVEYYLPWCPHCRKLAPHYKALADTYADIDSVVIANFNIDANDVKTEYEVTGGPTLIFYPAGNKAGWKKVSGGMDEESLAKYINKHAGSKFDPPTVIKAEESEEEKKKREEEEAKEEDARREAALSPQDKLARLIGNAIEAAEERNSRESNDE